ncbi:MAG: PadR family transcriptional regulator [Anaerolineales bacterium]|nr:PadR family transcriptional regulator [Anaerolineales bacterium]MCB8951358.1 PadR family transcriptional regulator [Ardenticatenales bacterium]
MSVRNAILGLLAHRPRHGYELHDAFEAMVGGVENWDLKPAQVYTTLARLEKKGLVVEDSVEQAGGPEKHIYTVTDAGMAELRAWFSEPVTSDRRRDEFFLKLMLSVAITEGDPRRLIYVQRASLYKELHAITAQRSRVDPRSELAYVLLLDQAVMHLEADLRWLEMVEARLDEISRQPIPEPVERPRGRPPRSDES